MSKDFYKTLNLTKDCSYDDIKKAYRKLSLETHPDKGGNEEKFKEISEAYQVLSDPDKRKSYDMFGSADAMEGDGMGGMNNPFDLLNSIFGRGGMGMGMNGFTQKNTIPSKIVKLQVPVSTFIKGDTIQIKFNRKTKCEPCKGTGSKNKQSVICNTCKGNKTIMGVKQLGPGMIMQTSMPCTECNGMGKKVDKNNLCVHCLGTCVKESTYEKDTYVSPTLPSNFPNEKKTLVLKGEGDYLPEVDATGDAMVVLDLEESSVSDCKISIPEGNIHMEIPLKLEQVLLGFKEVPFRLPSGEIVYIESNHVVDPYTPFVIKNEGLQLEHQSRGSVLVTWKVVYPKKLTEYQVNKLKKVFKIEDTSSGEEDTPNESISVSKVERRTFSVL